MSNNGPIATIATITDVAAAAVMDVWVSQDAFKLAVFGSVEGAPEKQKSGGTKRKTDDPEARVGRGVVGNGNVSKFNACVIFEK